MTSATLYAPSPPDSGPVFCQSVNDVIQNINRSWLAIQGTPILKIKELLGHATLAMTERYAHLIPEKKR